MNNHRGEGGFDCEFVVKPQKAFQSECPVCLHVLREPYQVNCCGYAFCHVCIEKIEREKRLCPCCNEKFNKFEDKRLKRSLHAFTVHCSNEEQGCQWVGELGQLDIHLNLNPSKQNQLQGCQYIQLKCLHCSTFYQRSCLKAHQNYQCPKRPFSCQHCKNFKSQYEDVANNHWPVCEYYPVKCTNKCGQSHQRKYLKTHIAKDCPLTKVDCEFQYMGCKVKLPRKDMPAHRKTSIAHHFSLHVESTRQIKSQITILEEQQLTAMNERIARLEDTQRDDILNARSEIARLQGKQRDDIRDVRREIVELREKNHKLEDRLKDIVCAIGCLFILIAVVIGTFCSYTQIKSIDKSML